MTLKSWEIAEENRQRGYSLFLLIEHTISSTEFAQKPRISKILSIILIYLQFCHSSKTDARRSVTDSIFLGLILIINASLQSSYVWNRNFVDQVRKWQLFSLMQFYHSSTSMSLFRKASYEKFDSFFASQNQIYLFQIPRPSYHKFTQVA